MATRKPTARGPRGNADLREYRAKRDFTRTGEPEGASPRPRGVRRLQFVVQKHAASHLHYDLRLELDGVMKSWAVPKGPSLDPTQRRLAVEVEDHPMEYNTFEGTIPAGEYGGGTVMLWDRGTYEPDDGSVDSLRRGYERGDIKITFHGKRLRGSFALVRMAGRGEGKPQWLLIKHRDADAEAGWDINDHDTSVATGRTMDEIREGRSKVWHSNRKAGTGKRRAGGAAAGTGNSESMKSHGSPFPVPSSRSSRPDSRIAPMMASIGTSIPTGPGWTFEPKYDGVRVLAFASASSVRLITRNGKDKSHQFPEVTAGIRALALRRKRPFVLDGEIVAFAGDAPARFQALQGRMHLQGATDIASQVASTPAALIAFDLLVDGDTVLLDQPWSVRRKRLERFIGARPPKGVRLGDSAPGDGEKLLARARRDGWEGIIAKRVDSTYQPGARSRDWLKLKVEFRQEFVVGGYTEPRNTREHLGAILLGYFDGDDLVYVGHTGGGFTRESLAAMAKRLKRLERKSSPFSTPVRTNEKAHWVRPEVVVEVKFNEWTADGRLRQPIFLGVRDDKDPRDVTREATSVQRSGRANGAATRRRSGAAASVKSPSRASKKKTAAKRPAKNATSAGSGSDARLEAELEAAEHEGRDAHLTLGRGVTLSLSSLDKVWFPGRAGGYTKGDVLRHYVRVAPFILPVMADRPLVLKRFPDGINGEAFYQQKAPANPPPGVRVETIEDADGDRVERLVGGSLATLLYQVQLGTISVDPWHARVKSLGFADYSVIDLDPGPRAKFERVIEVAAWVKEELDRLGLHAALKTSGSTGLHIFLPLPPRTSNEAALLIAQLVATRVANAHPREATVERTVSARPKATVYVDYLQNVLGKSVAAAYAVRARPGATVSTPLEWRELTPKLDPRDFTIETVGDRLARVGDIWALAMSERNTAAALKALTKR
ncbi:MAG TPA: DNA ligase D [Gemmatimonadaceae bacterium]|nr:DNA ligase D [Gemmatimonadaceae bacterium]